METKIFIGVPTGEYARHTDFYDYMRALSVPDGTLISYSHGSSPARNRNILIEEALTHNCSHIFFLDDDMAFKPDILNRLIAHDKDVVTALYLMRHNPHQPLMFDRKQDDGKCFQRYLGNDDSGLIEIINCGLGACLINTRVFQTIPKPWITLGQIEIDSWCDDIDFFNRVSSAGFKIYCDVDTPAGHMASCTIWPHKIDGNWVTAIDTHGDNVAFSRQIVKHD